MKTFKTSIDINAYIIIIAVAFRIGNMFWYATRKDRAILVRTVRDKKIILTPDEPEQFLAALNSY